MNKQTKRRFLLILLLGSLIFLPSCASIRDKLAVTKGELVGQHFDILVYDNYGNKTLKMDGSRIGIGVFEGDKGMFAKEDDPVYDSSVLEITVNGDQMIQVGNTMIFAEDGLDMVEDFDMPTDLEASGGIGLMPIDRYINDIKNQIGKPKTIIILTPRGIPVGVYEGRRVFVSVPKDLPKMTRLNIDNKSLYIHRANYIIMDTDAINEP